MTWVTVATLLAQYGLPFVTGLIDKWTTGGPVTVAEWQELAVLAQRTPEGLFGELARVAGIPTTDARYQQILALIQASAPPTPAVTH